MNRAHRSFPMVSCSRRDPDASRARRSASAGMDRWRLATPPKAMRPRAPRTTWRPTGADGRQSQDVAGEEGQILILLLGLVGLILMVLGLGWDASNWFLGHRALDNLADGAAIAAASDVDLRAFYASDGREIRLSDQQALATVRRYLTDAAGDSGLERVSVRSVRVERVASGPRVTVEVQAATPVAFLTYLDVVAPEMVGSATATAEIRPPPGGAPSP
jgi:hypothetical protein